jgi:adenylyltransferase/sulfurtransferase
LRSGQKISEFDYDFFCGTAPEISPKTLAAWKAQGADYFLLDVRTPEEANIRGYGGTLIPLAELGSRTHEIPRNRQIVVHCQTGKRSRQAAALLIEKHGFKGVVSLAGTPAE